MGLAILLAAKLFDLNIKGILDIAKHRSGLTVEEDGRWRIWQYAFDSLSQYGGYLTGFGESTGGKFLYETIGASHFHNVYINVMFDSGIIGLSVYLYAHYIMYRRICKCKDVTFRNIAKAGLFSLIFYCMFEAGNTVFTGNYMALLPTIIFGVLPHYRE